MTTTIGWQQLIDTRAYPLHDPDARAALVADARRQLAEESCVVLPGFITAETAAELSEEVAAAVPAAYRRENMLTAYAVDPFDGDAPADHPTRRTFPFRQHVVATDLLPQDGKLLSLYRDDDLTDLVADILGLDRLHRTADCLLSCTATSMTAGDEHGWHFDSNDFVVSLLLQAPDAGGVFEFAPYVRGETDQRYDDVDGVMTGDSELTRAKPVEAGTLMIFCGRRSLHRVSPIEGDRARLIGLFCYDRQPGMQFPESARLRAVGRSDTQRAVA